MRTTLTFSDATYESIRGLSKLSKKRISVLVDQCVQIGLPLLMERLPKNGETLKDSLLRRLDQIHSTYKKIIPKKSSIWQLMQSEQIILQKEVFKIQNDAIGLDLDGYREILNKSAKALRPIDYGEKAAKKENYR